MATSIQSNLEFKLTSIITVNDWVGDTFTISKDLEREQVINASLCSIVFKTADRRIVERMQVTIVNWTATIVLRWLDQSDTKTEVAGLKKERRVGTSWYLTMFASDLFDKDGDGTQTINANIIFGGSNTFTNKVTISGTNWQLDTSGAKKGFNPPSLTQTEIDALPTTGTGFVYNSTVGEYQQLITGTRTTVSAGSTQPNASETVAGKVEIATQSEVNAGTRVGWTGAILTVSPDTLKVALTSVEEWATVFTVINKTYSEDLVVWDLVCNTLDTTIGSSVVATSSVWENRWRSSENQNLAIKYVAPSTWYKHEITSRSLFLLKFWTPVDNITLWLYNEDFLTLIDTSSAVNGSSLSGVEAEYTFNFTWEQNLIPWKTYYLILQRSWVSDNTNFYNLRCESWGDSTSFMKLNSNNWTTGWTYLARWTTGTIASEINNSSVKKAKANDSNLIIWPLWVCLETKLSWQVGGIQYWWIVGGFVWLSTWYTYYAGDTAWSISLFPSAGYKIEIGKAISNTTILLKEKRFINIIRTITATSMGAYDWNTVYKFFRSFSNKKAHYYIWFRPTTINSFSQDWVWYSDWITNRLDNGEPFAYWYIYEWANKLVWTLLVGDWYITLNLTKNGTTARTNDWEFFLFTH